MRPQAGLLIAQGSTALDSNRTPPPGDRALGVRPGVEGHAPDLRKHLSPKQLDAGEDIVLLHARPAHTHREMSDPGPMLRQQHVDHVCGGANGKTIGGEAAQARLGRSIRVERESPRRHDR